MKFVIAFVLIAVAAARPDDPYKRLSNFDVNDFLDNDRLFNSILNCVNGDGKCTPDGKDLKELLPEGIQTSCAKCSENDKPKMCKTIVGIQTKAPEKWGKINNQYNPKGEFDDTLKSFIAKYCP